MLTVKGRHAKRKSAPDGRVIMSASRPDFARKLMPVSEDHQIYSREDKKSQDCNYSERARIGRLVRATGRTLVVRYRT